jgi:hypothetical protein
MAEDSSIDLSEAATVDAVVPAEYEPISDENKAKNENKSAHPVEHDRDGKTGIETDTRADDQPVSDLLLATTVFATNVDLAEQSKTIEHTEDFGDIPGSPLNCLEFFDSRDEHDPFATMDLSEFTRSKIVETSREDQGAMMVRSYANWKPWGMRAVCGGDILAENNWVSVDPPPGEDEDIAG